MLIIERFQVAQQCKRSACRFKGQNVHDFKRISNGDDVSNYSDETRTAIENYLSVFKNICINTKGFPDAANDILEIK